MRLEGFMTPSFPLERAIPLSGYSHTPIFIVFSLLFREGECHWGVFSYALTFSGNSALMKGYNLS